MSLVVCCLLFVICCSLSVVCCSLFGVRCSLFDVLLFDVWCFGIRVSCFFVCSLFVVRWPFVVVRCIGA